jgi:hypothetical protein
MRTSNPRCAASASVSPSHPSREPPVDCVIPLSAWPGQGRPVSEPDVGHERYLPRARCNLCGSPLHRLLRRQALQPRSMVGDFGISREPAELFSRPPVFFPEASRRASGSTKRARSGLTGLGVGGVRCIGNRAKQVPDTPGESQACIDYGTTGMVGGSGSPNGLLGIR